MKKREQEEECTLKTVPEHEPKPEPESDCRLYLSCFRLFSTLRMSRPAALDDVLLFLAVSLCDPFFWSRLDPRPVRFWIMGTYTTINTENSRS